VEGSQSRYTPITAMSYTVPLGTAATSARLLALAASCALAWSHRAVPTPLQLAWHGRMGAIIHYNMATDALATGHGCGRGNWLNASDPKTFGRSLVADACPDTDSWLAGVVAANASYAVLVAKHNCGFATWPTAAQLPDGSAYKFDIAHSSAPHGCDVVKDFLGSCAKYGVTPGMYYSFATNMYLNVQGATVSNATLMHGQVFVTQREFFDIALFQIGELWSRSSLLEIWADGGIPRDPYFHAGITALRDKYQSSAAIYNGFPTFNDTAVRWIGNEDGAAPDPTWSSGSCDMGNGGHGPGEGHATTAAQFTRLNPSNAPCQTPLVRSSAHFSLSLILLTCSCPQSHKAATPTRHTGALPKWTAHCRQTTLGSGSRQPSTPSTHLLHSWQATTRAWGTIRTGCSGCRQHPTAHSHLNTLPSRVDSVAGFALATTPRLWPRGP
jgi:hypothetical protein